MPRLLHRKLTFVSLTLALAAMGCGAGSSPPPPASAPAPVASAAAEATPKGERQDAVDLRPVAAPELLALTIRVKNTSAIVAAVREWSKMPMPDPAQLLQMAVHDDSVDVLDFDQPIDAVMTADMSTRSVVAEFAVAAAVKDLGAAKAKLSARYNLEPAPNGVLRMVPKATSEPKEPTDMDVPCALVPAAVKSGTELICAEQAAYIEHLAPYLARTLAREVPASDVVIEVRNSASMRAAVVPLRALGGDLIVGMIAEKLDKPRLPHALSTLIANLADEAVALVGDMDRVTELVKIDPSGIVATTKVDFASKRSLSARLLTPHPEMVGPAPALFWQLPADSDSAHFALAGDVEASERIRKATSDLLDEYLKGAGVADKDRENVRAVFSVPAISGATVYASGVDFDAMTKVTPGAKKGALLSSFTDGQWMQVGAETSGEAVAKSIEAFKSFGAALATPSVVKAFGQDSLPVTVKSAPLPKGAWPKGSAHFVISFTLPADDSSDQTDSADHEEGTGKARPSAGKKPAKKASRAPTVAHLFIVPDGKVVWVTAGVDTPANLAKRALDVLPGAVTAKRLSSHPGLEALRTASVNFGGFTSIQPGLGAAAPRALSRMPHRGEDPLLMLGHIRGTAEHASYELSIEMPRTAIEDLFAGMSSMAAHH